MFVGKLNLGQQNEMMLSVQRLWLVPFSLSNKTKMHSFFFFLSCVCVREDESSIKQEMSEKMKQSLESNENSVEVSGVICDN